MTLEVRDPVVAAIVSRTAAAVPGVARLHELPWRPGSLVRSRGRSVEVERAGGRVVVSLRLVVRREQPVVDVIRTVQRSVVAELVRLTGLDAEVGVVVVDLD